MPASTSDAEALNPSYSPDPKYNDSIIVGAMSSPQVIAHEIGHILLDSETHINEDTGANSVYLMAGGSLRDKMDVTDSRRFTPAQAKAVATKRKDLLMTP